MGISQAIGPDALQPGLVLVRTETVGTGVSSHTASGVFNATYDNYRVVMNGVVCSVSDTTLYIRPGNDTTASSYASGGFFVLYTGTGNGFLNSNNNTEGIAIGVTSTTDTSVAFDVYNPNLAKWTRAMGMWSADLYAGQYGGVHKVATAYTSMTVRPASGTMTGGTIRVYGYRN